MTATMTEPIPGNELAVDRMPGHWLLARMGKRVLRPGGAGAEAVEPDFSGTPDLSRLTAFLETKTVWHPKGR